MNRRGLRRALTRRIQSTAMGLDHMVGKGGVEPPFWFFRPTRQPCTSPSRKALANAEGYDTSFALPLYIAFVTKSHIEVPANRKVTGDS